MFLCLDEENLKHQVGRALRSPPNACFSVPLHRDLSASADWKSPTVSLLFSARCAVFSRDEVFLCNVGVKRSPTRSGQNQSNKRALQHFICFNVWSLAFVWFGVINETSWRWCVHGVENFSVIQTVAEEQHCSQRRSAGIYN